MRGLSAIVEYFVIIGLQQRRPCFTDNANDDNFAE